MNSQHTPEPWQFSDMSGCDMQDNAYACAHIGTDHGLLIAELHGNHEEQAQVLANARLIAAAPQLLEELVKLRQSIRHDIRCKAPQAHHCTCDADALWESSGKTITLATQKPDPRP